MRRLLLPLTAAGAIAIAVLSMRGDEPPAPVAPGPEQPRYVLRGAQWRNFDAEGGTRFVGKADTIDYYDDQSAQLDAFEVAVLGGRGQSWNVTAPQGYSPPGSRTRLQLLGGVRGQGKWPDGEPLTFRTDQIWLDTSAETLETESPVELHSATRAARARGLKVSGEDQRLNLLHEVEMRYVPR